MERKDIEPLDLSQRLEAFADGELPQECRLEVLNYLAEHPQAIRQLVAAQRLRATCSRVIESTCGCGCPAEVKRRIAEMAVSEPTESGAWPSLSPRLSAESGGLGSSEAPDRPDHGGWKLTFSRWMPVAAAAMFFVMAVVALNLANNRSSLGDGSIIPVSQVERFQWRHTRCSRAIDALAAGRYPQNIEALPGAIADTLGHQPYPVLDLAKLGYAFERAGPCGIPGARSIHLIYKARPETGRDDRLSLWIEPDDGKLAIEPGKPYHITGEHAAHPVLVWKDAEMVYYLVGDSDTWVDKAASVLSHPEL